MEERPKILREKQIEGLLNPYLGRKEPKCF
jgi:hypothetical protein